MQNQHSSQQSYDQDMLQLSGCRNHIPNYAGFVPGIRSENLFGKTFGKITLLTGSHTMHQGSDLPADLRYQSEVKDAYFVKHRTKDRLLYGKVEDEPYIPQPKRVDQKERPSTLTYNEAVSKIN